MMKPICAVLVVLAGCAHGSATKPDAPPQELLSWADRHPLAAQELCGWERDHPQEARRLWEWVRDQPVQVADALQFAATHPGFTAAGDPNWRGDVRLPNDPAVARLLNWAARNPDAAQQLEPRALEWTAAHRGC
jgi:hypothetical protein